MQAPHCQAIRLPATCSVISEAPLTMADQQAAAGAVSDNPAGTLFISYASEDADVAGRICAALEAGIGSSNHE